MNRSIWVCTTGLCMTLLSSVAITCPVLFFLFTIVCMAPDVLSAVKKENTIMAENVNHATVPVQCVQVPPDICLHNFHYCMILSLILFHCIAVTV